MPKLRRIVYRTTHGPITKDNPSIKYEYTNQILEDGEWKFFNRFIGHFGTQPIIWYYSIEEAEKFAPKDIKTDKPIKWDEIDKD